MTRLVVPLTLRQRAIIQGVIQANGHVTYDELAQSTRLSVRVIRYNMRSVRLWFASHDVPLTARAGYGIEIDASRATKRQLLLALARSMDQDVVLAGAQRRRAFLFQMLCSDTPASFQNLAIQAGSSRSTLIHDVGKMQDWLARFNIQIVRRPKVGIHLSGEEHMRRRGDGQGQGSHIRSGYPKDMDSVRGSNDKAQAIGLRSAPTDLEERFT